MQVSGTGRILIVDDDPMVCKVVVTILQKYGYSVFDARSGQHGLKCVVEHPEIELVLSDIVMPELSGPEMVNRILEMRPAMKVIFMTGYGDDNPPTHQVKRFGVLEKPFTIPGLLGAVRNGLEKHDRMTAVAPDTERLEAAFERARKRYQELKGIAATRARTRC